MPAVFEKQKIILLLLMSMPIIFILSHNTLAIQPFNVEIELPSTYQTVNPDSEVWFTIKLLNLANSQRVDVTLNYDISDTRGQVIVHNSKTVAIETQASFVADLKIPEDTLPGNYNIDVVVSSSLGESTAKNSLKIVATKTNVAMYYISAGIILIIILIFLIIKAKPILKKIKLKMQINRIVKEKLKKP